MDRDRVGVACGPWVSLQHGQLESGAGGQGGEGRGGQGRGGEREPALREAGCPWGEEGNGVRTTSQAEE